MNAVCWCNSGACVGENFWHYLLCWSVDSTILTNPYHPLGIIWSTSWLIPTNCPIWESHVTSVWQKTCPYDITLVCFCLRQPKWASDNLNISSGCPVDNLKILTIIMIITDKIKMLPWFTNHSFYWNGFVTISSLQLTLYSATLNDQVIQASWNCNGQPFISDWLSSGQWGPPSTVRFPPLHRTLRVTLIVLRTSDWIGIFQSDDNICVMKKRINWFKDVSVSSLRQLIQNNH